MGIIGLTPIGLEPTKVDGDTIGEDVVPIPAAAFDDWLFQSTVTVGGGGKPRNTRLQNNNTPNIEIAVKTCHVPAVACLGFPRFPEFRN